jgi:hypothetical protein
MGLGDRTFEIRKGRFDGDGDFEETAAPLGPVALPQSITGAEAEEHLKRTFGVDALPEVERRHHRVMVTQSAGVGGPVRSAKSMILSAILLLLGGGAVLLYFAKQNGTLDSLLQGQ